MQSEGVKAQWNEEHELSVRMISGLLAALLCLLGLLSAGLWWQYRDILLAESSSSYVGSELVDAKSLPLSSPTLRRGSPASEKKGEGYRWVDRKERVIEIPVSRAMQLIVEEQGKQ